MRRIIGMYIQRIREKVPGPQRKQCRRCPRLQFHFLCVSQWQPDLFARCRRKEIQDDEFQHSRRCHWCCRQYIHLPQRQLDLYMGQKREETQHPFRPIIGKRLRGYRITNFEVECPSTALAGGSQFDSFIIKTLSLLSLTKQHHYYYGKDYYYHRTGKGIQH